MQTVSCKRKAADVLALLVELKWTLHELEKPADGEKEELLQHGGWY
jgi:hypothetical protein